MPKPSLESLGVLASAVESRLEKMAEDRLVARLWERDPTPWTDDPRHHDVAANRLGWLDLVETDRALVDELRGFTDELRAEGYRHAVLLGMGGSSLSADVFRRTYGVKSDHLDLRVLDSTDPAAVRAVEVAVPLSRCLFVVASKSGTTAEVRAFESRFADLAGPEQLVAVTDPGTPLEELARERGYRRVFTTPPDVGGRYSALSTFGLLPAALLGVDLEALLRGAAEMGAACGPDVALPDNPGALLAAVMAEAARSGRDKLTLVLPSQLVALGGWIEQLVAESTGKQGRGVLPIDGEPLGRPDAYGSDRMFVHVRLRSAEDSALAARVADLRQAGHPVFEIDVASLDSLGGELVRWEVATALACSVIGVNAFDEPDVKQSKDITTKLLATYRRSGSLPEDEPVAQDTGLKLFADPKLRPDAERPRVSDWIAAQLERVEAGDYLCLLAYLRPTDRLDYNLQQLRAVLRDRFRVATAFGYGPRYLHSTGQVHKGGPNSGVFFQVTHEARHDVEIPGERHGFATLELAQAIGDFRALVKARRRVLRCHVTDRMVTGLGSLRAALDEALRRLA